jgi:hypothetical protein
MSKPDDIPQDVWDWLTRPSSERAYVTTRYPRGESGTAREASGGKRTEQSEMRGLQQGTGSAPPLQSASGGPSAPRGDNISPSPLGDADNDDFKRVQVLGPVR